MAQAWRPQAGDQQQGAVAGAAAPRRELDFVSDQLTDGRCDNVKNLSHFQI